MNQEFASSVSDLSDKYSCMKSICGFVWLASLEINVGNWTIVQAKIGILENRISYSNDEINENRFATDFSSESVVPFLNLF